MNKMLVLPLIIGLLLTTVGVTSIIVPSYIEDYEILSSARLRKFSSYEELRSFLNTSSRNYGDYYGYNLSPSAPATPALVTTFGLKNTASMESGNQPSTPEYSITNIQVEGVDEADIVKTDGEYIYVMSTNNVMIIRAYPATDAETLSKIKMNETLTGMFINGDKLVVFEQRSPYDKFRSYDEGPVNAYSYTWQTTIRVYDIADRQNPTSTRNMTVDGSYFDSRMIGDYTYLVVNSPAYCYEGEVPLPRIILDGQATTISAADIYYSNTTDSSYSFTTIIAVNTQNDQQEPTIQPLLFGTTSNIYVSQNNIYVTNLNSTTIQHLGTYQTIEKTVIHRIHVEDDEIEYQASGEVPGHVLNQFSMDEYKKHFRIATTTGQVWGWGQGTSKNHVYILNINLNITGKLEDLAPGEKIYSARFMGDKGYLVTFKKIDPLFVLDLSDPEDPQVLGQLKITGYSDYLHPYDETHIIGIGKETVEAEQGNFAWYQGVKISLFDVSHVEMPKEIDKYEIGDRGTDSPILRDHKAFLFDKDRNLLVIPVTVAEIYPVQYPGEVAPNAYGRFVWDGAYVFHISLEQGLVYRGRITHLDTDAELLKSGYWYQSQSSVKRSLYIDDVLYTISGSKVKMNSLTDLSEINEINLNQ